MVFRSLQAADSRDLTSVYFPILKGRLRNCFSSDFFFLSMVFKKLKNKVQSERGAGVWLLHELSKNSEAD